MESSVSSKDSTRSLIWSHFTQIGSDNTNMIRSACNDCKKELKCYDDNYSIRFEMKKKLFAQN